MENRYHSLDRLKKRLDKHRPLPAEVVRNLHANLINDWTYHSNAIEGNTLTRKETRVVLEGITVGGKSIVEHLEAINHREAILWLEEMVVANASLNEEFIKEIHRLVLHGIDHTNAGVYRATPIAVVGAEHYFPESEQVPGEMKMLITWYQTKSQPLHPVERAARVHADFVKVPRLLTGMVRLRDY